RATSPACRGSAISRASASLSRTRRARWSERSRSRPTPRSKTCERDCFASMLRQRGAEERMERKQASDYPQELLNLFDRYVHGGIDRRGFLDGAARFAVGGMTAAMLLDELSPKFAEAQQVPSDDKRLNASYVEYDSPQGSGKVKAYLARPASAKTNKLPGVLVV